MTTMVAPYVRDDGVEMVEVAPHWFVAKPFAHLATGQARDAAGTGKGHLKGTGKGQAAAGVKTSPSRKARATRHAEKSVKPPRPTKWPASR